jgi:hypothetical protein
MCPFLESTDLRVVQSEELYKGIAEVGFIRSCQDTILIHGLEQAESSDITSVHTASTCISGNGNY